jgi:hypothetical protein
MKLLDLIIVRYLRNRYIAARPHYPDEWLTFYQNVSYLPDAYALYRLAVDLRFITINGNWFNWLRDANMQVEDIDIPILGFTEQGDYHFVRKEWG